MRRYSSGLFRYAMFHFCLFPYVCLFDLEFKGPVTIVMVMPRRSSNLLTFILGRLNPLSGLPLFVHIHVPSPVTDNCPS